MWHRYRFHLRMELIRLVSNTVMKTATLFSTPQQVRFLIARNIAVGVRYLRWKSVPHSDLQWHFEWLKTLLTCRYSSDKSELLMLVVQQMLLALSAKAFCVSTPTMWNLLSDNYKRNKLLHTFRSWLKLALFHDAFQLARSFATICGAVIYIYIWYLFTTKAEYNHTKQTKKIYKKKWYTTTCMLIAEQTKQS